MAEFNADKIGFDLTAVSNFFNHKRTEIQKKFYPSALSASNGYIISYLCEYENQNIFQRDIEKEFDLSRSTVSTILKSLEAEGLIERKAVITDARLKKVVPTRAAKIINEACKKEVMHFFYDIASDLNDDDIKRLEYVLSVMQKNSERIKKRKTN